MAYCLRTALDQPFDEAVERVRAALAEEGFGVLSDIDVAATLDKKLGVRRPAYRILGACNPGLANQALQGEPDIGVLMPCNVIVRADEAGAVSVAAVDPAATFGLVANPGIAGVAAQVREKLERVMARLGAPRG